VPVKNSPTFVYFSDSVLRMIAPMSQASEILEEITTAYRAALSGKTVRFQNRELTAHDLPALRKEMQHWEGVVARENGSAGYRPVSVIL